MANESGSRCILGGVPALAKNRISRRGSGETAMFDISKLSTHYCVRYMSDSDADALLAFCLRNDQYYRYCGKQPSRELILHDLHITPPNTSADAKYYIGFYDGDILVAIMDLIDGYPDSDTAFIGFFMMNRQLQ
jgi:hypothetical protein